MVPRIQYSKKDTPASPNEAIQMKCTPYCQAIGSLMYATIATCPDITFAVSSLSQFLDNPSNIYWEAIKHVFHYLIGTKDLQLTFGGKQHDLEGFTNADGGTQEDWYAISGCCFIVDSGAISWSVKKQELVMLLTAEAEYVAATHTAKEAKWLHKLLASSFHKFYIF